MMMNMKKMNYKYTLCFFVLIISGFSVKAEEYFSEPEWNEYTLLYISMGGHGVEPFSDYVIIPTDVDTLSLDLTDCDVFQYSLDKVGSLSIEVDFEMYSYLTTKFLAGEDRNTMYWRCRNTYPYPRDDGMDLQYLISNEATACRRRLSRRELLKLDRGTEIDIEYMNIRGLFVKANKDRFETYISGLGHRYTSIILPIAVTQFLETPHKITFKRLENK